MISEEEWMMASTIRPLLTGGCFIQVVDMGLVQLEGRVVAIMNWWLHMYNHFHSTNYFVVEVYMYISYYISGL